MDCKVFRNEIEELESGDSLSAQAQAHADACMNCRTFQTERLSLRRLIGSLETVNAPPDFDFRLRARLAAAGSASSNSFRRARFAPGLKAISVAASIALLIAAAVVFRQIQSGRQITPTTAEHSTLAETKHDGIKKQNEQAGESAVVASSAQPGAVDSKPNSPKTNGAAQPEAVAKVEKTTPNRSAAKVRAERTQPISNDMAFSGTPKVLVPAQPLATASARTPESAASLHFSTQPVRILLNDRQGGQHSVSLEPVVFGAQNILERSTQRHPVGRDAEGIW